MNYIKFKMGEESIRVNLTDDGIILNEGVLKLTVVGEGRSFDAINVIFSNIDAGVKVYGCTVQKDGSETDEYDAAYYAGYTHLSEIQYNLETKNYTVSMTIPNDIEERIAELEEAVNFLAMGGEA